MLQSVKLNTNLKRMYKCKLAYTYYIFALKINLILEALISNENINYSSFS